MRQSVGTFASTESEIEEIRCLLESLGTLGKDTESDEALELDQFTRARVEDIAQDLKNMHLSLQSVRTCVEVAAQQLRSGTEESRSLVAKARDLEAMLDHLRRSSCDCSHNCVLF